MGSTKDEVPFDGIIDYQGRTMYFVYDQETALYLIKDASGLELWVSFWRLIAFERSIFYTRIRCRNQGNVASREAMWDLMDHVATAIEAYDRLFEVPKRG